MEAPHTPENINIQRQFSMNLWRTVWNMPQELRCIITHIYLCNRSFEELPNIMNIDTIDAYLLHEKAMDYLRARIPDWQ